MNREIKFRAMFNGKMVYFNLMDVYNNSVTYDNSVKETLCEYIGLHDKNGKEIYEGDVVKSRGYNDIDEEEREFIETVEFNDGAFSPICFEKCENFEVIGNIYENKELLNNI